MLRAAPRASEPSFSGASVGVVTRLGRAQLRDHLGSAIPNPVVTGNITFDKVQAKDRGYTPRGGIGLIDRRYLVARLAVVTDRGHQVPPATRWLCKENSCAPVRQRSSQLDQEPFELERRGRIIATDHEEGRTGGQRDGLILSVDPYEVALL
jgi:hypothetical protein